MAHPIVSFMNRKSGMLLKQGIDNSIQAVDAQLDDPKNQWFHIPVDNGYYAYKNVATGNVLDHWYEEKGAGNTVAKNSGIHHSNHQWFEFKVEDVFVGLRKRKSKRFLDHYYTKEIRVKGDNCLNVERHWCLIQHQPARSSIEIISFRNPKSGKILENNGNVDAVKSRATTDNHLWRRIPVWPERYYSYQNVASGMVLSLGHECVEATDDDIDKASNQWRECDVGRGLIALRNRESDFVLTHYFEQSIRAFDNKIHCDNNLWTIESQQQPTPFQPTPLQLTPLQPTPLQPEPKRPKWIIEPQDVIRQAVPFAEGGSGSVYRAEWQCTDVVLKEITVDSATEERRVRREVELWLELRHDNVVPFNGANLVSKPFFIVSKLAANGTLSDYLGASKDNRKSVWRLLYQVAAGLKYLHNQGIIHGDLKGNNIVVSELGTAMLTDFGLSFLDTGSCSLMNSKGTLGAMQWRAPEFARQTMTRSTFASDIYSFGMCIIAAINGVDCPWGDWYDNRQVREFLRDGNIRVNKPDRMTADQWNIVHQMIAYKTCYRPGLEEVLSNLKRFASEEDFKEEMLRNSTPRPSQQQYREISQNQLEQQEKGEQKRENQASQRSSWWSSLDSIARAMTVIPIMIPESLRN